MERLNEQINIDNQEKDQVHFQNLSEFSTSYDRSSINESKCTPSNGTAENGYHDGREFTFEIVLLTIVGSFGIVGNTAAIVMFVRMKDQMNFHRIMIMLSTFDSILILLNIVTFVYKHFSESFNAVGYHYIALFMLPVAQIAMTGSIYSTMAITVERYLIACKPFYVVSNRWSANRYIIPIVAFSITYNLPKFFEIKASTMRDESNINKTSYTIDATELRLNQAYYIVYTIWMNFIFMGLLPFLLLIVLNGLTLNRLVKQIRYMNKAHTIFQDTAHPYNNPIIQPFLNKGQHIEKGQKSKNPTPTEGQLAKISLTIVLVYIICHGVRWVPNIYELVQISDPGYEEECFVWPVWIERVSNISRFLITLNSSVNFYIYYANHLRKFRKYIFCKSSFQPVTENIV